MSKKITNVNLSFKCSQNWNDMEQQEGYKLCSSCKCKVYDFTTQDANYLNKIIKKSEQQVCGKFNLSQLSQQFLKYAASTIILSTSLTVPILAQVPVTENVLIQESDSAAEEIFFGVIGEQMPELKMGYKKLFSMFAKQAIIPENCPGGKTILQFFIDTSGKVQDIEILKGFYEPADHEALRVFKNLDIEFVPGQQNGRPVKTRMLLPIEFASNQTEKKRSKK